MANSKTCIYCGANLDFGERCSCIFKDEDETTIDSKPYYRAFPKLSDEQKLESLQNILNLVK